MISTRPGTRFVTKLPRGQRCVGIIEFQGQVIVACDRAVYRLRNKTLAPIRFQVLPPKC